MSEENLEIEDAVAILSGNSEKIKEEIESRQVSAEDLEHLYKAEKSGQQREGVLRVLKSELKHSKVARVLDAAREDVETLEEALEKVKEIEGVETNRTGFENLDSQDIIDLMAGDLHHMEEFLEEHRPSEESLKQLLEAERKLNDRDAAIELIKETIERERLELNMAEAEEDIESLEESVERLQETSQKVEPEEKSSDSEEVEEKEETPEDEEDSEKEDTEDVETEADESENDDSKEEAKEDEKNKKEKLADELNLELTEEELQSVSIEQLQQVKKEKKRREKIIDSLKENGMSEEELRKASTEDLQKIKQEMDETNSEDQNEDEKSKAEMEREAEEDLQMLMGAGKASEDTEEDDGPGKLESMKEKLGSRFKHEDTEDQEDNSNKLDEKKFKDVLKEYQNLEEEEAVIKTAHITKGYLERVLNIERELTYKELAEKIPEDSENLQELSEMFNTLNKEQYTQKISFESDKFIETCRSAVDDLEW